MGATSVQCSLLIISQVTELTVSTPLLFYEISYNGECVHASHAKRLFCDENNFTLVCQRVWCGSWSSHTHQIARPT
jgi:hypothetical protein